MADAPRYGVLAEFEDVAAVYGAAKRVREAGYTKWDVHSPFPIHGMDEAMGLGKPRVPFFMGMGALIGVGGALLMQWWMNGVDYAILNAGKPMFAWEQATPITFELGVLLSAFGPGRDACAQQAAYAVPPAAAEGQLSASERRQVLHRDRDDRSEVQRRGHPRLPRGSGRVQHRNGGGLMRRYSPHLMALCVILAGSALAGCRGETSDAPPRRFFPGLDDQPKFKAQDETEFFADGRTMRDPPANTVAFGRTAHTGEITGFTPAGRAISVDFAQREAMLEADDAFYRGRTAGGELVRDIPIPVTEALIELGRENYNIYCIVCHGGLGEGDGMVGQKWSYVLPSLQAEAILKGGSEEKGSDGYIYDRIRNGVPNPGGAFPLKMPSYATKVSERESWAIVAYIRALQRARHGALEDLPDRMRLELDRSAGAPARADDSLTDAGAGVESGDEEDAS